MDRLLYLIVFTPDIDRMKVYYRDGLALEPTSESPFFVSFNTGGARLALMAMDPTHQREMELCFASDDLEADIRRLRERGAVFTDAIQDLSFGRVIHLRDPEGNLLSLLQPAMPQREGTGPPLSAVIVDARDLATETAFYRDRLGMRMLVDSPWWVEFDTGPTHLALHPRVDRPEGGKRPAQSVSFGFTSSDLDEWVEELCQRGVPIVAEPTDRGFGRVAGVRDPDGNDIALRDTPAPPTLEEKLAEEFESGDAPRRLAIRKPVNKNSKAVSRLVLRPDYRSAKKRAAKGAKPAARGATARPAGRKPASVRGAGPEHARLSPKSLRDPKRARAREATGHQKTAARRTLGNQKRAVARASKARPVKHASASRGRRR